MLTFRQERFCQRYAVTRSATDSYRAAYRVKADTAASTVDANAAKLMAKTEVATRIEELIAIASAQAATDPATELGTLVGVLKAWTTIATADPNELIGLKVGCCRHCYGLGHQYQWREHEYLSALAAYERQVQMGVATAILPDVGGGLDFNHTLPPLADCPACRGEGLERVVARDTSKLSPSAKWLYGGVKQKKDGVEVIIADRQKALENLTRMLGGFTDNVKINASVSGMVAAVTAQVTDPQEAARIYQEFIKGNLAT